MSHHASPSATASRSVPRSVLNVEEVLLRQQLERNLQKMREKSKNLGPVHQMMARLGIEREHNKLMNTTKKSGGKRRHQKKRK
jgi:hypothetical protein